jgi:hypothetical protein
MMDVSSASCVRLNTFEVVKVLLDACDGVY